MTAAAANYDRGIDLSIGGLIGHLKAEAAANPFQGSALSFAADGQAHELVAGEPFAGICISRIKTADAGAADGDVTIPAAIGLFLARLPISGVAQDDVAHRRLVYATDDNTFGFDPATATASLIGAICGFPTSGYGLVICATHGFQGLLQGNLGFRKTAATGNQTLTTNDVDKTILVPNTAALTLTLPAAADWAGRRMRIMKTTAAGGGTAVTLDGSGDETINGAATNATIDAQYDCLELESTGAEVLIVNNSVA